MSFTRALATQRPMKSLGTVNERDMNWLPDMDLNHDKQIQSLLCYRYTIGQMSGVKLKRAQVLSQGLSRGMNVLGRETKLFVWQVGSPASLRFGRAGHCDGSACLCAGGTSGNSPTFQRWVDARNALSSGWGGRRPNQELYPQPRQPSLSGLMDSRASSPTFKRWAIVACPSGTKQWRWCEPTS
jgi:hypothetical protein